MEIVPLWCSGPSGGSRRLEAFCCQLNCRLGQRSPVRRGCQVGLFVLSANSCLLLLIDDTLSDVNDLSRLSRTIVFRILIETTRGPKTRCFASARGAAQILHPNERYGSGPGLGRKHALAVGPL
jgi:hypothetical protein